MTLLTTEMPKSEAGFLNRFDRLWSSLRRVQVAQGLACSLLVVAAGLAVLVVADYWFELTGVARAIGLVMAALVAVTVLALRVIAPLRWWTKPRTAAEIERRFPKLGQRIRTVVQYAGLPEARIHDEGVTPSLLGALEVETDDQAAALPLGTIVTWRPVWATLALAALPLLGLLIAAGKPDWRIAIRRALLADIPYTTITVAPGNVLIDQGESLTVSVGLVGRPREHFMIQTRPEANPAKAWTSLDVSDTLQARLEKVHDPLTLRAIAGPVKSPTYQIKVRYPLGIKELAVALNPPAYTGLKPRTEKGGDVSAIEGTSAVFRIAFDSPPSEASMVMLDPPASPANKASSPNRVIPLTDDGSTFSTKMLLTHGLRYRIEAKTADGRVLPRNQYRIDVHEDRAPRVSFEEPDEALEVHPLAEVVHRIRVGDDFGLTRAGIVFRFNDGEEKSLIVQDFAATCAIPVASTLEKTLLLEILAATPTDSVTYYGFAEDNYPGGAHRSETDLRFIDLRPFKREYKKGERSDEEGFGEGRLATLEELIARQRFNLNRSVRLARKKPGDRSGGEDPLKIAGFEETLAGLTREFTEGVEGVAGQRVEPLHQAEESMLAAVSALDLGKNADAPPRMTEAVRHLIEVRRKLAEVINLDPSTAQALRQFDRTQVQKIRKPKSESEEAEQVVEDLEKLADDEDFVYATIPAADKEGAIPDGGQGDQAEDKKDPRDVKEMQEKIADRARALEEKLKALEAASDLAKARMGKAAEAAEKASGALARGNSKEAAEMARDAAAKLHELARQVKGEITREPAEELAMARDLAAELAEREAELGEIPGTPGKGESPGGRDGKPSNKGGTGADPDRLDRLHEAALTLEAWLNGATQRVEGDAAGKLREAVEASPPKEIAQQIDRVGELILGGKRPEASERAKEVARALDVLAARLDVVHRGIIEPRVAALVEAEKKVATLTGSLKTLKTDAEISEWHREAGELADSLERAGLAEVAADLRAVMEAGGWQRGAGAWNWRNGQGGYRSAPDNYYVALHAITRRLQDRIQDMILKDVVSGRDEATPPQFRELVDRYYEVLSKDSGPK
jgi:hypothetical protein